MAPRSAPLPPVSDGSEITTARAMRGGITTLAGQAARMAILVVNLTVLGRLLSPADFGIVALALSLVGVAELLRDFGLSAAAIQAPTLSQAEKSNLFWLNTALGAILCSIIVASAWPIGAVFGQEALGHVMLGLAAVFLLNGLGTQYQAQLSRDFRFGAVAVTDVSGQVAGLVVGITMAALGMGYWSLVGMQVVASATTLPLRVVVSGWRPSRPRRDVSVRHHVTFGINLGAAQVLGYIANSAPTVALGAFHTNAVVGYYSRSYQLISLPINQVFAPLTNVALSALARVTDPASYRKAMRELALLISIIGIFCFSYIASTADVLVPFLLGDQWVTSVPVVQLLGIGTMFQALTYPYFWAFMSLGRTDSLLRYNLVTKSMLAALAVAGAFHGVEGAALGFAAGLVVSWPICAWWLRGEDRIDGRGHVLQSMRLLAAGLAAGLTTWYGMDSAPDLPPAILLVVALAAWTAVALGVWILLGGRQDLRALGAVVRRTVGDR